MVSTVSHKLRSGASCGDADPFKVFVSSVWVKLHVSLVMLGVTFALPYFLDVQKIENRDGFITLLVVALICATVGARKLYHYRISSNRCLPD